MGKKSVSTAIVFGVVFVIINVLFWGIPFPKGASSIIAYVFSLISVILGFAITSYAFSKGEDIRSKVYGFPVFRIGYLYAAVQAIFTFIICIFNAFFDVPSWVSLVFSIVVLGLAGIGVIGANAARDIVTKQEEQFAEQTKKVTEFKLNIDSIASRCPEGELKKKINTLAEEFRYSDPVSSDALKDIEQKLSEEVAVLRALVTANPEEAMKQADEVQYLLAERNQLCKATKGT